MTPEQFAEQIRRKARELRIRDLPLIRAAGSTHALMSKRIFVTGQASSGEPIGNYSTKDTWINPEKTATIMVMRMN